MERTRIRRPRVLPWLLGLAAVTAQAQQTIIVNPGGSIQNAVNQAAAGDTVLVRAGTYTQRVSIAGKNGLSSALITLKGDPGAILDGTGLTPVNRQGLITISNSSYIRVEGFEIRNFFYSGTAHTPVGILVHGFGSNLRILNNRIHDIRNNSSCTEPCAAGAHGIGVFGTSSTGLTDLLLSGNEVYNNVLQASEAFVINGNVNRFEVLNNNVHDNNNIGFDFIGFEDECAGCGANDRVRNGIIRGNTASNNSSTTNPWYSGDASAAGFYVDGGQYLVFERNRSTGNDLGFEFASEHAGKATEDVVMMNNFVYNNREVGVILGGFDASVGEARRIHVYNNSFYKNKGWGSEIVFQYKVKNSNFANNIFFGEASAAECYENYGTGHTGNVWGKNIWWGTSTASNDLPGTKVIADPKYIAPTTGNLRIQSTSPAIGAGAVAADIGTWTSTLWDTYFPPFGDIPPNGKVDFNGEARIEGTIDLGADEYGTAGGGGGPTIVVDGNTADWSGVASLSTNGVGGLTNLKAHADASNLYIVAIGTTSTNYAIFIDKDAATATGYADGLWSPEGSDYMLENGTLYRYTGNGTTWSWTTSGVVQTGIQSVKTASAIEVRIPKANLSGMGATIRMGVDSEDANWNNVASIPAAGGPQVAFNP